MNSEIDIPLKVVKFNLDAKKRKNMFVFLFLYNVDIVAFVLFVEIYKNISVAKLSLSSICKIIWLNFELVHIINIYKFMNILKD